MICVLQTHEKLFTFHLSPITFYFLIHNMNKLKHIGYLLSMVFLFFSCISPKSTIYMQDKSGKKKYTNIYSKAMVITENYKIQTNDYLYIRVITDKNLLDSEESYIYPNDIIYVEPIKAKMFGFGETFSLSFITSLISFYLLLRTFN